MTGAQGGSLRWLRPRDQAPILLAIPQAGSGAHYFQPLQRELATAATVLGVQLPGRADRWNEPMPAGITSLLSDLAGELVAELSGSSVLLLGCSFGGLLGYELLRRFPQLPVSGLVLASCRAPRWWLEGAITAAERDLLLRGVRQVTAEFDLDEDSRRLLERPLLADIELARTLPGTRLSAESPCLSWPSAAGPTRWSAMRSWRSGPTGRPVACGSWSSRPDTTWFRRRPGSWPRPSEAAWWGVSREPPARRHRPG